MYDTGEGVSKDYKQAMHWFKKSAEQGNAEAQYNLGVMYYTGKDTPKDYKQAMHWFKKSIFSIFKNLFTTQFL